MTTINQTFDQTQQPEKRTWVTPELELIVSDDILGKSSPRYAEGYHVGGFGVTGSAS